MTLYDNSIFARSDFPFHLMPFYLQSDEEIELHHHQYVECVWISGGRGEHLYQGQISVIKEGDVFVIEPGEEHGYHVTGNALLGYNVLFQPSLLAAEFELMSQFSSFVDFFYVEPFLRHSNHFIKHMQLNTREQVEIRILLERLTHEVTQQRDGYHMLVKTYLIQLFIFLSRCYQDHQRQPFASLTNDHEVLARICEFVSLHAALPLTLDQVSQMCGMSPSTFKTKFKRFTGKTFLEFRNTLRLQNAKERLAENNETILAIAQEVGFDDLSFFHHAFKLAYGMAPGEYRKWYRSTYSDG